MRLLSREGERHEDRIPVRIVSSVDEGIKALKEAYPIYHFDVSLCETDYDKSATVITIQDHAESTFVEVVYLIEEINERL